MMNPTGVKATERFHTIVIGGGQAGLAVGYYLARQGHDFVILDAYDRLGHSWRRRWDSLRLFTSVKYNNLPGMSFPAESDELPSKDEMADYLEAYAARFDLPVRLNIRVDRLTRQGRIYTLIADTQRLAADHVVVATGAFQSPKIPAFASDLDPVILQLHSSEYRNPSQLLAGDVLVVGVGQSGAEISKELVASRQIWLSGQPRAHLPDTMLGRRFFDWLWPLLAHVRRDSWLGRWVAARMRQGGDPVVGISAEDLMRLGVRRLPRIVGVKEGKPMTVDEQVLEVDNVIWATGFCPDYHWIHLPIFGEDGYPLHKRGVVEDEPGLYFVGLRFQYRPTSHLVGGVGADANHIVKQISAKTRRNIAKRARDAVPN